MSPVPIESLGAVLRGSQRGLVRPAASGVDVAQVGAAVLPGAFPVPVPDRADPVAPRGGEATIETFVADGPADGHGQAAASMGTDGATADWWQPLVDGLISRVRQAIEPLGVELAGPIYVTASATAVDQVIGQPHLDDDQLEPEAGVGLVAIAASHDGPRLARGVLACPRAMATGPLGLDQSVLDRWFDPSEAGPDRVQHTGADLIVLFPRFGQLHAGPALATAPVAWSGEGIRNLLVLRADTIPQPTDEAADEPEGGGR